MKLQYLGDRRDFYKYDLLVELGRSLRPPGGLTVIPMLTAGDDTGEGNLRRYRRRHRDPELHAFVQSLQRNDPGEIKRVAEFLTAHAAPTHFMPEGYLQATARGDYFAAICAQNLKDSLVFLDPDTGLEVDSKRNERYLHYAELRDLAARASGDSVFVVYQHKHRMQPQQFFDLLRARLLGRSGIACVAMVDMGDIAFLVTALAPDRFEQVCGVLTSYITSRRIRRPLFRSKGGQPQCDRS